MITPRNIIRSAGIFSISIGVVGMVGWILKVPALLYFFEGLPTMKFNTALSFFAFGWLMIFFPPKAPFNFPFWFVLGAVSLLCLASFSQDALGYNAGIGELFVQDFHSRQQGMPLPGRMSGSTSLSFFLFGLGILLINTKKNTFNLLGQSCFHLVSIISFIAIIGYLFDVPSFYKLSFLTSMALHTSLGLLVISVSASFYRPQLGITGLFTGTLMGNIMARRIFPQILGIILVLGLLGIGALRYDLLGAEFGTALLTCSFILVSLVIIYSTSKFLNNIDLSRKMAENSLSELNNVLETRVVEKTKELWLVKDRLDLATKSANIGIWDIDLNNNSLEHNETLRAIWDVEPDTHVTLELMRSLTHPADKTHADEMFRQAIDQLTEIDFEHRIVTKKEELRYLKVHGVVHTEQGKPVRMTGAHWDITDAKEKEKVQTDSLDIISEQNKRLLNFAHIVSHNLRSHSGNFEMLMNLLGQADDEDERAQILDHLKNVSASLSETIKNLNDVVKIQVNINDQKTEVYLWEYLQKTIQLLGGEIERLHAKVSNSIPQTAKITYNPAYLESILLNFLTNALKYRHPDRVPEVALSLAEENGKKVLIVEDNGLGIDLQTYGTKLFGMYKTFHKNPDAKGIGLFITKNQVESMGGKIEVESEVDKGTTFRIYLS